MEEDFEEERRSRARALLLSLPSRLTTKISSVTFARRSTSLIPHSRPIEADGLAAETAIHVLCELAENGRAAGEASAGAAVVCREAVGVVKINCDAVYVNRRDIGYCGVGVLFRDHLCNCLGCRSIPISGHVRNKDEAKLEGVRVGLEESLICGYDDIIMEVDNSEIAQVMKVTVEIPEDFYE
ncbi:hypothetical protein RHGRI_022061 [Rhododendron griersonianum]|uniref:RNase H type-1 domain-containing protein n=1 Tax=Rhododendron griersonianum TaxID=479676 RepID=A0AAV6JQM7_9ERIC|nr:hypothetical protein RHGRI_022061 [Rhododendron griersonianum]